MNIEEFREYCIDKKGATESFPFGKLPEVLVFKVMGKMFTATDIDTFESISLKCDPDLVDELRASYDAVTVPAYMSKKHWNRVVMDGTIPDDLIKQWIDNSYQLVVAGLPKKLKEALQ
ncbi:MmcQ/YjbR family DNA-binding protein [Fulvivirgaceae bacterium BMA10]|uniref:MmcQ/YjbR family DNA-binding protein n=1 Tax=Splendidivirga corallicola TaxID=3051826 RepID=A0ABT8KTZ9_9BACT|nr:MmcQ/YjbR family DNA-binding protein [Fulvivirgaceae bacterium BMA10]